MVRKCVVCGLSDQIILSHRFPKNESFAKTWKTALELEESLDDLLKKYVVCTSHFKNSHYRNNTSNFLNTTSVPNLLVNKCNHRIQETNKSIKKITLESHQLSEILESASETKIVRLKRIGEKRTHNYNKKNKIMKLDMETPGPDDDIEQYESENEMGDADMMYIVSEVVDDRSPNRSDNETEMFTLEPSSENQDNNKISESEPNPKLPEVHDKEVQTDSIIPEEPPQTDNKEDKFIQVMYPEFSKYSRTHLIEQLIELQKTVELLESKNAKFQNAIKNLLN